MAHKLAHERGADGDESSRWSSLTAAGIGRRECIHLGGATLLGLLSAGQVSAVPESDENRDINDEHQLLIDGSGTAATYEFTVDGHLEPDPNAQNTSNACISGCNAEGAVTDGYRHYRFTGGLRDLTVDGDAVITLDGKPIAP